ncbi:MAG TPA: cupredoxin domain-containing protein [Gammaproteobacteria bacterium]|nr:cupredoxin domain-containing protein [Gammaproteobacteria bacterium]
MLQRAYKLRARLPLLLLPVWVASAVWSGSAQADAPTRELSIRGRGFSPAELNLPAGVQVQLLIHNEDDLPAEFESYDLSREVVVPAHGQVKVYLGPLDPGRYRFFNDFYPSAEGWVVVAAAGK